MARLFTLHDHVVIHAPIDRFFWLSTSVAIVERELGMHPSAGRTTGFVTGGDTILWKGWQLGLPQHHQSLIEAFNPPLFFRDRMISGRFRTFEHDHSFLDRKDGEVDLSDELRFTMPLGRIGDIVGALVLAPHIRRVMRRRFVLLKRLAETDEWRSYLPSSSHA